jgi:hypothetical protein
MTSSMKQNKEVEEVKEEETGGFKLTQERINVINTATEYLNKIIDFEKWSTDNFFGPNVGQCYYIFEDFVRSNKHLIPKINKLMPPPRQPKSYNE